MTPTRDQIVKYIAAHPGTTTVQLVSSFEDPANKVVYDRAYACVWIKMAKLANRGEIVRVGCSARREGQQWDVPRREAQ